VRREPGRPKDLIRIFRDRGCNCFRLRLFVNPNHENAVVNDLPYTLALGKRVKTAGAKPLLNFHYSDTWADPGHQTKPAAWRHLPFPAREPNPPREGVDPNRIAACPRTLLHYGLPSVGMS